MRKRIGSKGFGKDVRMKGVFWFFCYQGIEFIKWRMRPDADVGVELEALALPFSPFFALMLNL